MRSTINTLVKSVPTILVLSLLLTLVSLFACNNDEPGFGIYLVKTDELVLSDQHIEGYYWDSHAIELNMEGIEKWNSYMTYDGIPKLEDTLFSKDFVLKIKGEEIYQGKFYSMVISASYSGIVILDALTKLDENQNIIVIQNGYPWSDPYTKEDPRNNQKVFDYLESKGLLKPGDKWLFE